MAKTDIRIDVDFFDHPKTIKLQRRYGPEGIISIQRLWVFAAKHKPSGILTGMDAEELCIAMRWSGDSEMFVKALVELRFLDVTDNIYSLHDWTQHNPWVSSTLDRSDKARFVRMAKSHPELYEQLKSNGFNAISSTDYHEITKSKQVTLTQCTADGQHDAQRDVNVTHNVTQCDTLTKSSAIRSTPYPSPSPIPKQQKPPTPLSGGVDVSSSKNETAKPKKQTEKKSRYELSSEQQKLFDQFWAAYPKHVAKQGAVKAWQKITPEPTQDFISMLVDRIETAKNSESWRKNGGEFIPHPSTWLNSRRWEDETQSVATSSTQRKEPIPPSRRFVVAGDPEIYANRDQELWDRMTD